MKPREEMTDEETRVEDVIAACTIHGSSQRVLDQLVALREEMGPFGHLVMAGLDWSGVNAGWESESMRRLAEEVMPRLRRHAATLKAAE